MKKLLFIFVLSTLVTCFVLGGVGIVSAQEKKSDSKKSDTDEFTLEEVTVTASRNESLLSKTPIAVTAVTGNTLTKNGLETPLKLEELVPNLSISRSGLGLRFTVRGVSSTDFTEKGDPSFAFMLDNVYLARPQFNEVSFFDIARVEVLRGPQGTLYGKNTTAGVMNVIPNRPKDKFESAFNMTVGNYGTYLGDGMVNVPVSDDFAMRFAFAYQRRDSYIYQPYGDYSIDPYKDNISFRLQGLYDINDKASLFLQADYSKLKGTRKGGSQAETYDLTDEMNPIYISGLSSKEMRTDYAVNTLPIDNDDNTWGINTEFKWDFGPVLLTYLGSYRETHNDSSGSVDQTDPDTAASPTSWTTDGWQHQEEIRLSTTGDGPFQGQTGVYYFKENSGISAYWYDVWTYFDYFGFPQDPTINESKAAFGQGTYSLTPDLRFTAGVRYSHDFKSRKGFTHYKFHDWAGGMEVKLVNDAETTFTKTTWRLGLDYDLSDETLLYGSVATGYKAGGFNDGCESSMAGCNQPRDDFLYFDPENITAYEAGIKTRFSEKVILNASAFYYDYTNLQLSAIVELSELEGGGYNQVTRNAAKAENKGVEIESVFMPTNNIRITANLAWLDAEYKDYIASNSDGSVLVDYAGKQLDYSPEYTATLGYNHRFPLPNGASIEVALSFRWSDSYVMTSYSVPAQYPQPSFHKTDLSATYNCQSGAWYFQVFVKNIEDEITLMGASSSGITPGDPRTYGTRVGYRF